MPLFVFSCYYHFLASAYFLGMILQKKDKVSLKKSFQSSSACGETVHEHYTTFKDGVRRVDYVLAYETDESDNEETNASDNEDLTFYGVS